MRTTKRLLQVAAFGAVTIGTVAVAVPDTRIGKRARRLAARLDRDLRYAVASSPGLLYRLAGRHPDPDVPDDILASRIRSRLGPLERRLDVRGCTSKSMTTLPSFTATSATRSTPRVSNSRRAK